MSEVATAAPRHRIETSEPESVKYAGALMQMSPFDMFEAFHNPWVQQDKLAQQALREMGIFKLAEALHDRDFDKSVAYAYVLGLSIDNVSELV
jgi:hypothetical protein